MAGVFIVGTGRVGTGLALAIADTDIPLVGMWNRGAAGRARAEQLTGQAVAGSDLAAVEALAAAEIILLTVADDAIPEVAAALHDSQRLRPSAVVAHTSGCRTAADLAPLLATRCASLHPLCACPEPLAAAAALHQALYVIEGSSAALPALRRLVASLGGRCETIAPANKSRYHAAAVLASNLMVALLDCATEEARAAGLDDATEALTELALGAIDQARTLGTRDALTGPVARGDVWTIAAHLRNLSPEAKEVYTVLSRRAVMMARARGLPEAAAEELSAALLESQPRLPR